MSEHKIAQINSHTMEPKGCNYLVSYTVALCDDGSLWELARAQGDHAWTRLPDIPQEPQPAPPAPLPVLRELDYQDFCELHQLFCDLAKLKVGSSVDDARKLNAKLAQLLTPAAEGRS